MKKSQASDEEKNSHVYKSFRMQTCANLPFTDSSEAALSSSLTLEQESAHMNYDLVSLSAA